MPVTTRQTAAAKRRHASSENDDKQKQTRRKLPMQHEADLKEGKRHFGLVQETYQHNLYHLIIQAILWNQTHGNKAIIVLRKLLKLYPDPETLAKAIEAELTELLQPIGLHRLRAKRLIALGQMWVKQSPNPEHLYKVRYKCPEVDSKWEIAHLPGIGKYAIDSYRIFFRDQLRGIASSWDDQLSGNSHAKQRRQIEPEWKKVLPTDKDLRAFLTWAWSKEGYHWDPILGSVTPTAKTN